MKKLLCLMLILACGLLLVSCSAIEIPGTDIRIELPNIPFLNSSCKTCVDNDGDLKCDKCGGDVECTKHKDSDKDLKCDKCDAEIECKHKDENNDGKCDTEACTYVFCSHKYADEYSYNKTHHWFALTCDCDADPGEKAAHVDDNNDGECDVCEYNGGHKHAYAKDYSYNDTHHWIDATCDHDVTKDYAAHADRDNDGRCDGCAWDYGHKHTYSTDWNHDATYHWHDVACEHSVSVADKGLHTDYNNDGICDGCSWDYDHEHEFDIGWISDGTKHWHPATCGHDVIADVAAHVNELDANGKEDGICDVCEYVVCTGNHTFNPDVWGWDETGHWHPSICGHSTADMERKGHDYGQVNDGICKECGYVSCEHPIVGENVYDNDATHHWNKFSCTHTVIPADRKTSHADCDENFDGVCDVCNYQYCDHPFDTSAWENDGSTHWHPTACGHNNVVNNKLDEAAHLDETGNDGACDVCGYQLCDHPIVGADIYDNDATHHWNKLSCTHVVPEDRKSEHIDDDNDGVCTVCGQFCQHDIVDEDIYESDETYHWNNLSCTHVVPADRKAEHTDTDDNGLCDTCGYNVCGADHTYNPDAWASNENGHWHPSICGHANANSEIIGHADVTGAKDGLCDTCGYQVCNHTYVTEYTAETIDAEYHWLATTCGCVVPASAKEKHVDADHNGWCEICMLQFCEHPAIEGQYDFNLTHHWSKTQCGHELPVEARQLHDDADNDGYCEVCGRYCEHPQSETAYSSDATHHWHTLTDCTHNVPEDWKEAHIDSDRDNKCDVCGRSYIDDGDIDVDTNDPIVTPPFILPTTDEEE